MTDLRHGTPQPSSLFRAPLIAVDAGGYCWRVLPGEHWSMCPVNPDNSPIPRPLTFYAPVEMTEAQALVMVNAEEIAEALGWGDFRACSPDQVRRFEGLAHAVGLDHLGQPPTSYGERDLFNEQPLPPTEKGTTLPTSEQMDSYYERLDSQSQATDDDTIYG